MENLLDLEILCYDSFKKENYRFRDLLKNETYENGIKIKPTIDESGRITYASGSYRLDGKTIEVSWKNLDKGMTALQLKGCDRVKVDLSGYSTVEKISEELYLIKR